MQVRPIRKIFHSVFIRLLFVIMAAGICLNLLMGGMFHWVYKSLSQTPLQRNLIQYAQYLITDLGSPPSLARAQVLSKKSDLAIRFEGKETSWATAPDIPALDLHRWRVWHADERVIIGRIRGHHLVVIDHELGRFTFDLPALRDRPIRYYPLILMLFVFSAIILTGVYLTVRRILKPLRGLSEGVTQVGSGNLQYQVPVAGANEFIQLAQGFNAMTMRIRRMVQAKEQLLRDVSHELRSPLTRIKVALEFLPKGRARTSIAEDLQEMETMIGDMLEAFGTLNTELTLHLKPVNLIDLIKQTVKDLEQTPPGIQMDDLPPKINLSIDLERIKTVFRNILTNAIKYSLPESAPVSIALDQNDNVFIVRIRDHGMGIPKKSQPFIFEPFYRVDKSRVRDTGGYGLGLSICKSIMHAHGGNIRIESTPNEGTTVFLSFPKQ